MNKIEFISYLIEVGEINQEVIDRSMEVSDFPLARKLLLKIEGFIENILHPKNSAELDLAKGELLSNCILNNREIKQEGIKFVDEIVNAVRLKNNFTTKNTYYSEDVIDRGIQENKDISDIDLYNQGVEHIKQNEYQKSIKKFSEAIDLKSDDPAYFSLRGGAYYYLNIYDKAIEDATKAIDLKSDDPAYFILRGWAYYCLEKYDKAIEDATKAIDLKSDNPNYYQLRAYARREESKEFIIDQKIADNLEDIKNYLNEADRYYAESRIIEAIDYYEKVLSKSNSEIKEILGNDAMIRINNRILEYRKMIKS